MIYSLHITSSRELETQFDLSRHRSITVLTGAGISAESGLKTFRDSGGLWENSRIEDVATPEAFLRDPVLVWTFYSARRRAARDARPNPAHVALAKFGAEWRRSGRKFTLITQNVDGLHERAEAESAGGEPFPADDGAVAAMHGTLALSRCTACERVFPDPCAWFDDGGRPSTDADARSKRDRRGIPLSPCCGASLRPHIVWFGEIPLHLERIGHALSNCDVFVTIGTSGQVYPAAGFLEQAKSAGALTVCLNIEPLPQQLMVDLYIEGPASRTVPEFFTY